MVLLLGCQVVVQQVIIIIILICTATSIQQGASSHLILGAG